MILFLIFSLLFNNKYSILDNNNDKVGDDEENLPSKFSRYEQLPTSTSFTSSTLSPQFTLFQCLAVQIYVAEMEAEDYFVELTSHPLNSEDIVYIQPVKHNMNQQKTEKEFELTDELITPPNQIIGRCDRVYPIIFYFI